LRKAASGVRVVVIENDKELRGGLAPEALAQNLLAHGIVAQFDIVDAKDRPAAEVLREYLRSTASTMLVMGAYGHSRLREFVLGGTTRSMLEDPPVPVLLSH